MGSFGFASQFYKSAVRFNYGASKEVSAGKAVCLGHGLLVGGVAVSRDINKTPNHGWLFSGTEKLLTQLIS